MDKILPIYNLATALYFTVRVLSEYVYSNYVAHTGQLPGN